MTLEDLNKLAGEILEAESDVPKLVDKIEEYFDAFEQIIPELENLAQTETEALKEIQIRHEKVLALTMELRDDTSQRMKDLKARGKSIIAYKNKYPKRVSMFSVKKG